MELVLNTLVVVMAFIGCQGLTMLVRRLALCYHYLDIPNQRSSHVQATPRLGGVAFVVAFFIGIFIFYLRGILSFPLFALLMGGGLAIGGVGLWDDIRSLPARFRMAIHILAAVVANGVVWGIPQNGLSAGIFLFFCFSLVWLTNLYNFMDGIDGIAASETLFVCASAVCLLLISGDTEWVWVFLLLFAVVAAFLIWNWSPARIFMGDIGSGFLGYTLGVLALFTLQQHLVSLGSWIILLGAFLVDTSVTLLRRVWNREPFYQAHRSHFYQKLAQRYNSHSSVTIGMCLINILWLFPLSIAAWHWPHWEWFFVVLALCPLVVLVLGNHHFEGRNAQLLADRRLNER